VSDSSPVPSQGPSEPSAKVHLDSWKEIAAYVKRDVSTVQRWEKREGMPVHRHLHDKRGSVYALSFELDAWFESRKLRLQAQDPEQGVEAPEGPESRSGRRAGRANRLLFLAAATAIVLISAVYVLTRSRTVAATGRKITSLAVLPMKNLSGDPEQQYFVEGLTDELTTDLARVGNLRVISHASATLSANTQKSLPEIARDLNVDAVLTGTVERSGSRIRVRTELVRPATSEVLWADSYDRDLGDVLRLEGEVSQTIARQVGIKLAPQTQRRLEHKSTTSPEAHDDYLRALYFMDWDDKEGAVKCLRYLGEATAKDPNYANAYALMSPCYDLAYYFGILSGSDAASKEKAAALKAVELDDGLAEAHYVLADYYFEHAWDFGRAEREYKRALELDPNSSAVHEGYSDYLRLTGTKDKGVEEIRRAHELDPLSLHIADKLGWTLLYARRYDEAVDQFRKVLEMDPNYRRSIWGLARTYELKGMYKEAISESCKIPRLPNLDRFGQALFQRRCSLYENIYGGGHINRKWYKSARQEIKDGIGRDDDAYSIATLYAETGENDKAMDLLEKAYTQHDGSLQQLKVDPRLDSLRSSPRFQALLRRMNFP
jgi:TolB-like protein/tetratricopeptide (TPR) repeat protein